MSPEELESLWDPTLPPTGVLADLESRLSSLRSPEPAPPLDLPPRQAQPVAPSAQPWAPLLVAAAITLVAGALLYMFVRGAVDETAPAVVRAPKPVQPGQTPGQTPGQLTPTPEPATVPNEGWRVVELSGEGMCRQEGVEPGAFLPEGASIDTGPEAPARLTNGSAGVDLHPNGQLRHADGELELVNGRLWAELPPRADGQPWRLRVGSTQLEFEHARFVLWMDEGANREVEGLLPRELGVDLVQGQVQLHTPQGPLTVRKGETCVAQLGPLPMRSQGDFVCTTSGG